MKVNVTITILIAALTPLSISASRLDIQTQLQLESHLFIDDPQFEDQLETFHGGLVLSGDLRWTSTDRKTRVLFEPYFHIDSADKEKNYIDIREATVSHRRGDWDVLAGIGQIFWGVAESRNVVDVVNQGDALENFDQSEKLGQPLLRLSRRSDFGTVELYYLPFFRQQQFVGNKSRLRIPVEVDQSNARFERNGDEWAGDIAVRYSNAFDAFDLGVHGFYGTSREPLLISIDESQLLTPFYQERKQIGFDLQYTNESWLFKLEAASVELGPDSFLASVGGFEYTFFDVASRGSDVGLIGEYLYDDRDLTQSPVTLFDNDLFVGSRVTLNDTQDTAFLAGVIVDAETSSTIGAIEFQRRIGSNVLLELEGNFFSTGDDVRASTFKDDSHITLRLSRYF